jgi:hypothetical protein
MMWGGSERDVHLEKKNPVSAFAKTGFTIIPGNDLLSRAVTSTVPSALRGLSALFGMGRGVSPAVSSPEKI